MTLLQPLIDIIFLLISNTLSTFTNIYILFIQLLENAKTLINIGGPLTITLFLTICIVVLYFVGKFLVNSLKGLIVLFLLGMFMLLLIFYSL